MKTEEVNTMKIFFQVFLYLNVGIGSLFFVIWLFTSMPFVHSPAFAEESASPANSAENTVAPDPAASPANSAENTVAPDPAASPANSAENTVAPDPAVVKDGDTPSLDDEQPAQRQGVSVEEPPVPLPPPIPPANEDTSLPEDKDTVSNTGEDSPPVGKISSDLNNLLESAKQFQESKKEGMGASIAQDLMQINKKVANIYKILGNYNYDPDDRRDPFVPFQIQEEEELEEDTRQVIPSYPTGKYKLSEIKLVGIKWNSKLGPSKALFRTPDNVIHPLQKNDRIGINKGVIYQLREDEVVILEPRPGVASKKEDAYVPIIVRLHRWMDQDKNQNLNRPQQPQPNEVRQRGKGV